MNRNSRWTHRQAGCVTGRGDLFAPQLFQAHLPQPSSTTKLSGEHKRDAGVFVCVFCNRMVMFLRLFSQLSQQDPLLMCRLRFILTSSPCNYACNRSIGTSSCRPWKIRAFCQKAGSVHTCCCVGRTCKVQPQCMRCRLAWSVFGHSCPPPPGMRLRSQKQSGSHCCRSPDHQGGR